MEIPSISRMQTRNALRITLKQIRYFLSTVETGSLSRAAVHCCVSQSAITLALKTLEASLGRSLLERKVDGVSLTRAGSRFLPKARQILAAVSDATADSDRAAVVTSGEIRIGVTYTVIGYFLGQHLVRFGHRYPDVRLTISELERRDVERAIQKGVIDVAVMLISNLRNRVDITSRVLTRSQRRLWVPQGHRLLEQPRVALSDVAEEPYVMLTTDEAAETANRYWRKARIKPCIVLETSSIEAVRSVVAAGLGVSILSDMVFRPWSLEGDRIEARQLDQPIPSMDVGVAWRTSTALSAASQEFVRFLEMVSGSTHNPTRAAQR